MALYYSESPVKKTDNPLGMLKVFDLLGAKRLEESGGRSGKTPKESPEEAAPTVLLQPPFHQGQWKVTPAKRAETVTGAQSMLCTDKEGEKKKQRRREPGASVLTSSLVSHLSWQDLSRETVRAACPSTEDLGLQSRVRTSYR